MQQIHGGDIYHYENVLDFSANINPLGVPKAVIEAIEGAMEQLVNYPDITCERLRKAIAEFHGIEADQIICGNGAADVIFRFVFAVRPKRALVLAPTFAEYEQALKVAGAEVRHHMLNKETFCLEEDVLESLTEDLDVVVLCNPNNPTGQLIPPELLKKIVVKCKRNGIRILLDECFLDFLREEEKHSWLVKASRETHLLVLRAFTKMYAVPGIRLGYGISGDRELIEAMYAAGSPWNVSVLAQEAGIVALSQTDYVEQTKELIAREKEYLYEHFTRLRITFWKTEANYVLFRYRPGLKELLVAKGILIRDCGNYENLDGSYYRIAVKSRADNERFLRAFEEVCNEEMDR